MKNPNRWYQACSSLDAIEDTQLGIDYYKNMEWGDNDGKHYLAIYGLLQCLFVQQDAVANLGKSLGCQEKFLSSFRSTREARNQSIGHPTEYRRGGEISYNFISRSQLTKDSYYLIRESDGKSGQTIHITEKSIEIQELLMADILNHIIKFIDKKFGVNKENSHY